MAYRCRHAISVISTFALSTALCSAAIASEATSDMESDDRTIIVSAPGGAIDTDDALSLSEADFDRAGPDDLLNAMTRNIAGITLQDAQNNPWQPNIVYRGFTASPLQGLAQGLAVYLDGVRFNQPFGDSVQFDLVPEAALSDLQLLDASPVYGLNALGGALTLATKTGATHEGLELTASGGAFGYAEGSAVAGFSEGDFNGLIALQGTHDSGWRNYSPSRLYNGYIDVGYDGATGGVHFKAIGADTKLTGNGVSPVELLAADRDAIFTHPDLTRNHYARFSLHPWVALSDSTRLEASLYHQELRQSTVNGDAADIEECEDDDEGFLCLESATDEDDDAVLVGSDGQAIEEFDDIDDYGVRNSGKTRTRSNGILAQLIDERDFGAGRNILAVGFSYDQSRSRFATSTRLGALNEQRGVDDLGITINQPDGAIALVSLITTTDYFGIFLSDRFPITERLSVEIGLRWNDAKIELQDQIGTALNGRHHFSRFNPGIELDYAMTKGLSLRAGYSESNRVPTPAELSCADENAPCSLTNFFVADPPLSQVVAKSWELGANGETQLGAVQLDWLLSAYRTTNNNDIQYIASQIRGRAYFQNVGDTRRQGVELTLQARLEGLTTRLSYAYIDARYRTPFTLTSPSNPVAEDDGTISVMRGGFLPGIAKHSASFSADYEGEIGARHWSIGGDIQLRSGQFLVGDEANLNAKLPGYAVVNLRGGIELSRGLQFFGELRNVFNRKYATFGTFSEVDEIDLIEAPDASNPRAYGPAAPRRWLAGLKAKF